MANQQRSVIVTAIVLAIILGGALVWLLNRTPAEQLATQAPEEQAAAQQPTPAQDGSDLVSVEEANRLAQAQGQPGAPTNAISPTDAEQQVSNPATGDVQGVTATAPTGPAETMMLIAVACLALGSGGLLTLSFPRL